MMQKVITIYCHRVKQLVPVAAFVGISGIGNDSPQNQLDHCLLFDKCSKRQHCPVIHDDL